MTVQLPRTETGTRDRNQRGGSHHEQSQLVFRNRFQVWDGERFGESGASSQSLGRLHGGGETVEPRPLARTPHGRAGLQGAVSEGRGHGGAAQELVQVETHCQGGQTLHVGTVDQLLATDHVRLKTTTRDQRVREHKHIPTMQCRRCDGLRPSRRRTAPAASQEVSPGRLAYRAPC